VLLESCQPPLDAVQLELGGRVDDAGQQPLGQQTVSGRLVMARLDPSRRENRRKAIETLSKGTASSDSNMVCIRRKLAIKYPSRNRNVLQNCHSN
jgi:hypothetical protein